LQVAQSMTLGGWKCQTFIYSKLNGIGNMNKGELNEKKSDFAFLLQHLTNTKFGK
jgi:hypothetical protein